MSDTKTPRTDSAFEGLHKLRPKAQYADVFPYLFACQLERELAAEREAREKAEKHIIELQGVPFSDRNYGAMKDKLNIAREALENMTCRCLPPQTICYRCDALAKINSTTKGEQT